MKYDVCDIVNRQALRDCFENMYDEITEIWNSYAQVNYYDEIYPMFMLCDYYGEMPLSEFLNLTSRGFDFNDDYFYINGYAELVTTNNIYDVVDVDLLIDYIIDTGETFDNDEIDSIITTEE